MKKGILIILSGPSGVGKGTVRELVFKDTSLNLAYSISCTSRSPRPGEKEGIDYFYISKEDFYQRVKNNEFLEYAEFADNCYGTPEFYVDRLLNEGKNVVLEIEVQGALQVMKKRPDALSIFILPPSLEELESRIRGRGTEDEETIQLRLSKAERELSTKDQYKYNVVNNVVEDTAQKIINIIKENIGRE